VTVQSPPLAARELGSLETLLWLADQRSPKHFILAAEIAATPSDTDWRSAINAAQRRHPLCQVFIRTDDGQLPHFSYRSGAEVPLTIISDPEHALLARQTEEELATSFSKMDAILIRATVLKHPRTATLLVTTHHAIGDGLSVAFWIRDVVRALAGEPLDPCPLPAAQEDDFVPGPAMPSDTAPPYREPRLGTLDRRTKSALRVDLRRLPEELGRSLREQTKAHGTTVHGAITAAIVTAGAELTPGLADRPVNLMSPVNARELLGRTDAFGIGFATAIGDVGPVASEPFWSIARQANAINAPLRSSEGFAGFLGALGGFVSTRPTVLDAIELERRLFPIDFMISNLGVLPFPDRIGEINILSLFGPAMILGMEGEQMIGVATIGSNIHLMHSSYRPMPGLLEATEAQLRSI
jgi:hypothetical protein